MSLGERLTAEATSASSDSYLPGSSDHDIIRLVHFCRDIYDKPLTNGTSCLPDAVILCYKIIRGLVLLSPDSFFTFVCNSRTRGHSFKLFSLHLDSIFFAFRVLKIWNSLPEDVVSVAHLSLFISCLVRVNLNQFLICNM